MYYCNDHYWLPNQICCFVTFYLFIRCRKAAFAGMVSGALGQFLASPTDLVKVQMQMEGRRRLEGKPPRYAIPVVLNVKIKFRPCAL